MIKEFKYDNNTVKLLAESLRRAVNKSKVNLNYLDWFSYRPGSKPYKENKLIL